MSDGRIHLTREGPSVRLVFDRPEAHNALSWAMYDELEQHCQTLLRHPPRVAILASASAKAFVTGTDIQQFRSFSTPDDAVRYESRVERVVDALERLPFPTIAIIEGWCTGGGLILATACDFRMASPQARFAAPMARTLGNCLSLANVRRLVAHLGVPLAKRLLIGAETLDAEQAAQLGFVHSLAASDKLGAEVQQLCHSLLRHSPESMTAFKEGIRRAVLGDNNSDLDLIHLCYGSHNFQEGIASFLQKRPANWQS